MTSFKMLLLRQFLSELDDILTQCSSVWFQYCITSFTACGFRLLSADKVPTRGVFNKFCVFYEHAFSITTGINKTLQLIRNRSDSSTDYEQTI